MALKNSCGRSWAMPASRARHCRQRRRVGKRPFRHALTRWHARRLRPADSADGSNAPDVDSHSIVRVEEVDDARFSSTIFSGACTTVRTHRIFPGTSWPSTRRGRPISSSWATSTTPRSRIPGSVAAWSSTTAPTAGCPAPSCRDQASRWRIRDHVALHLRPALRRAGHLGLRRRQAGRHRGGAPAANTPMRKT